MTMPIEQAAINLAVALGLSAVIGFERQWRNRLAGLRTNTLVSLGAATFVIFAAVVPGDASPTRVAAQVVSGIGFLGAGLIFREGLNVRGLNTAATLWCSAAIGVLAGGGYLLYATVATGFVVFVNLLLRPIVNFINRQPLTSTELEVSYVVSLTCRSPDEAQLRALLLQGLAGSGLSLRRLDSNDVDGGASVVVTAFVNAPHRVDADVERIGSPEPGADGVGCTLAGGSASRIRGSCAQPRPHNALRCRYSALKHDPEKLQTFRIRSCDRTNTRSEIAIQSEQISLLADRQAPVSQI